MFTKIRTKQNDDLWLKTSETVPLNRRSIATMRFEHYLAVQNLLEANPTSKGK